MAYTKQTWANAPVTTSPMSAARLAHIEDGIEAADAAVAAKYTKPGGGIPGTDLAAAVVTSLGKADTAVQPTTAVRRGAVIALGDSFATPVAAYDAVRDVCTHLHPPTDYLFHGLMLAGNPLELLGSVATAAATIDDIIDTHLPTVLEVKPEYVLTWSIIGDGPMLDSGETPTSYFRRIENEILAPIVAYGGKPILASFVPAVNGSNPGLSHTEVYRYNTWAAACAARGGYGFLDFYGGLVDAVTAGGYKTGYSADNLHPNAVGVGGGMIQRVRDWALRLPDPGRASLAVWPATVTGQSANALLAGTGGQPTGWTAAAGTGATTTLAAAPTGRPGNRMELTHATGAMVQNAPELAVTAGDLWELSCYLDSNGTGGFYVTVYDQSGTAAGDVEATVGSATEVYPIAVPAGTVLTMRGKARTGTTALKPVVGTVGPAGAKVGISQWTMRNLSVMSV